MNEVHIRHVESGGQTFVQTFGGQSFIDGIEIDDYGITVGDVSISGIPSSTMIALATQMVDHLILNGHRFEIVKGDHQDQVERLALKEGL